MVNWGGHDKVMSGLSHILGALYEELWLPEGSAATDGTGNAIASKIVGNANANILSCLNGADTQFGEGDDDLVYCGAENDNFYAGSGHDTLD